MEQQSYAHHVRLDPAYHFVAVPVTFLAFVAVIVDLSLHFTWTTLLLAVVALALLVALSRVRGYATKLQDRVVRAEENFRHYVLAGAPLDPRLTMAQIIALRFASDAEFPALAARAAQEGLKGDDIKRAVKEWRLDGWRV